VGETDSIDYPEAEISHATEPVDSDEKWDEPEVID
jgi:hypothetical protein